MIAELKSKLLAPAPTIQKNKSNVGNLSSTVNEAQDEPDEYQQVMSWGTPRLVSKSKTGEKGGQFRQLTLT